MQKTNTVVVPQRNQQAEYSAEELINIAMADEGDDGGYDSMDDFIVDDDEEEEKEEVRWSSSEDDFVAPNEYPSCSLCLSLSLDYFFYSSFYTFI